MQRRVVDTIALTLNHNLKVPKNEQSTLYSTTAEECHTPPCLWQLISTPWPTVEKLFLIISLTSPNQHLAYTSFFLPRPKSVTSRLRSHETYPRLPTRTKRYCSFVHDALSHYQINHHYITLHYITLHYIT